MPDRIQDDKARIRAKMSAAALLTFAKMPDRIQDDIIMHFLDNPPPFIIVVNDLFNAWLSSQQIVDYIDDLLDLDRSGESWYNGSPGRSTALLRKIKNGKQ